MRKCIEASIGMVAEALYKPFAFIAKEKKTEKSRGSRMKSMGIVDKNTRN